MKKKTIKSLLIAAIISTTVLSADYTLTPDGSYVSGDSYSLAPDGSYVSGDSSSLAPDGTYVGD
ncbi:hypothetical protein H8D36_05980 [archaeon]|nr:hypothetical protein [archaeon]